MTSLTARMASLGLIALLAACGARPSAVGASAPGAGARGDRSAEGCPTGGPEGALCALNSSFRDAYKGARAAALSRGGPVIISRFDRVILRRAGQSLTGQTISDRYHRLKAVAHVPLALHMLLYPDADRPLSDKTKAALKTLKKRIADARAAALTDLSDAQKTRQTALLDGADALIQRVLAAGQITGAEVVAYTRSSADDVLANARDAAEDQLQHLHGHVSGWLADMTPAERERLSVVVQVGHMPRIGSLTSQYFSALLKEPYEGRFDVENAASSPRVVVVSGRASDERLVHILGAHAIDERIGVDFFDDAARMHRDLLADATEDWIRRALKVAPVSVPSATSTGE